MNKNDFASQDLTAGQLNAIVKKLGGEEGALKFLRGELVVQPTVIMAPTPELPDFIVRVDRTIKPTYPDWTKKVIHPELELTGPTEYSLETGVELWLQDDQKNGVVTGNTIYDQLKKDDALKNCLGLADLLVIQAKGIAVFRKLYAAKAIFGWKSVVRRRGGYLYVPYLVERGGRVVLYWYWLDNGWDSGYPALRFSK